MKNIVMFFFILLTICLAQSIKEVDSKIGHIVDFRKESFEIFNDILIMSGEKQGNLSEKRNNDFYEKYLYEEVYGDFYDITKQELWEITGNGDEAGYYNPFPYKITSSSFLNNNPSYKAENLYDNSFKTAWVEGVKDYGIGEFFEYYVNNYKYFKEDEFTEEFDSFIPTIHEIHLFNGYVKSEKTFKENSRIKKLKMYVDGKPWVILELADTTSQQIFEIPEINYLKFKNRKDYKDDLILRFEILEVYKGSKYQDTCLTELLLYTYDRL